MSISERLLLELDHEVASTKKLIACIPTDKWTWKPHEKSMALGDLANHIVELTQWTKYVLADSVLDLNDLGSRESSLTTEELLDRLDIYKETAKVALLDFDENKWMDIWQLKAGEYKILEMPKVGASRFLVNNHLYHHRGQLSVYLRLLDIPIPGMYGPSADDN